jgi:hypothetical protein
MRRMPPIGPQEPICSCRAPAGASAGSMGGTPLGVQVRGTEAAPGGRVAFVGAFLVLAGASGAPPQLPSSVLDRYDFSPGAGLRSDLPWALEEVSGLTVTPDGGLFAHNDERAIVFQIDPETGGVVKAFSLGSRGVPGDFEGIAAARGRFAMVTSSGQVFEFVEGEAGSAVDHRVHSTGLGRFCEIEGLAYDPAAEEFLLPCKETRAWDLHGHLVVISVPLESMRPYPVPRVFLPLEALGEHGLEPSFHPSAIEVLPEDGTMILAAAQEEALVELTSQGRLVAVRKLSKRDHPQTEGLTFLPDGTLVLADEGGGGRGRITLYPPMSTPEGGHP